MQAKGFSPRPFRSRSRRTAGSLVASHARWKPPMPLIAATRPAAIASRHRRDRGIAVHRGASAAGVAAAGRHT